MNHRTGLATFALWAVLASTSLGQMGGMGNGRSNFRNFGNAGADLPNSPKASQVCSVRMLSADGKTVTGTLRLTSAVVDCAFGIYEIKPDKVQEIRLDGRSRNEQMGMNQVGMQRPGAIITTSGEEIEGVVLIPGWWRVETDLGSLNPNSEGLRSITFVKKGGEITAVPPATILPVPRTEDEPELRPQLESIPRASSVAVPPPATIPPAPQS